MEADIFTPLRLSIVIFGDGGSKLDHELLLELPIRLSPVDDRRDSGSVNGDGFATTVDEPEAAVDCVSVRRGGGTFTPAEISQIDRHRMSSGENAVLETPDDNVD